MVVTGLGLLFGGRADPARVRSGAGPGGGRRPAAAAGRLRRCWPASRDAGAELDEDGALLVSRAVAVEGRSRALPRRPRGAGRGARRAGRAASWRCTGSPTSCGCCAPAEQRAALDRYAGPGRRAAGAATASRTSAGAQLADDLADRPRQRRERAQEADLLRLGLAEIDRGRPAAGRGRGAARRGGAAGARRRAAQLPRSTAHDALAGDPATAATAPTRPRLLGAARRAARRASRGADPELAELADAAGRGRLPGRRRRRRAGGLRRARSTPTRPGSQQV